MDLLSSRDRPFDDTQVRVKNNSENNAVSRPFLFYCLSFHATFEKQTMQCLHCFKIDVNTLLKCDHVQCYESLYLIWRKEVFKKSNFLLFHHPCLLITPIYVYKSFIRLDRFITPPPPPPEFSNF